MTQNSDPFLAALHGYAAAARARDLSAFLALYDDDVQVFDMWGKWQLRGRQAWQELVSSWFASLREEQLIVSFDAAASTASGDLCVGHAMLTYTAVAADGRTLRSLDNRLTAALRRTGGGWLIFHEHTSAPVHHSTLKASLLRTADL
jgi:uncharacterized protein (TIGR02246 family)